MQISCKGLSSFLLSCPQGIFFTLYMPLDLLCLKIILRPLMLQQKRYQPIQPLPVTQGRVKNHLRGLIYTHNLTGWSSFQSENFSCITFHLPTCNKFAHLCRICLLFPAHFSLLFLFYQTLIITPSFNLSCNLVNRWEPKYWLLSY